MNNKFQEMYEKMTADDDMKEYLYVIVRKDMKSEQAVVQVAHVVSVLVAATKFAKINNTTFVVLEVDNEDDLFEAGEYVDDYILSPSPKKCIRVSFYEPDMDSSLTAIAVGPIRQYERHWFRPFNKLTFNTNK